MSNTIGTVLIDVKADTAKLVSGMDKAQQKIDATMKGMVSTAKNAAVAITGYLAFDNIAQSAQSLVSTAGKFEQYAVSLKVLSGSVGQSEKDFLWIQDFTSKTPYTLDQTMEAFIRLKSYGIDATDGSLKTLGDTSAALGKPLMSAVEAMADAMVGENERLKEFGIRASKSGDTIAYSWTDASGKAKEKIIQNNTEIIKSTLEAIFNEKYKGMMDEQSKTWEGMVSNLEDSWTQFKVNFAKNTGLFDEAKSLIESMNEEVKNLDETLQTIGHTAAIGATMFAAYKANGWINAGIIAIGGSFLGAKSDVDKMLASTILLEASMMRIKKFLMANTFTLTVGIVITGSEAVKAWLEGDKVDPNGSKTLQGYIAKTKAINSIESQANSIAENQMKLNERLNAQLVQRAGLIKAGVDTKYIDKAISDTKISIKDSQKVLDNFSEIVMMEGVPQHSTNQGQASETAAQKKAREAAEKKVLQEAKKLQEDIGKARRDAMIDNADREAEYHLSIYKAQQDAIETTYELQSQAAIDAYNDELDLIERNANALASSYDRVYDMITPEIDKLNTSMMEDWQRLYDAGLMEGDFAQKFYVAWQKKSEDTINKVEDDTIKLNTVFEDAFKSMEDSMVNMFMTGKIKADDFFNTIIEGIIRMQIRNSITEPLTKAVSGVDLGGMFSSAGSSIMSWFASANGNAFNKGAPVYAFANGGAFTNSVVSQPTMAPMSLFGEAGPEAIMPLTRIGSSLGVKATPSNVVVNIQNNSGTPVSEDNVSTSFDGGTMIVNVVLDAITRNKGGIRDTIRGVR